MLRKTAILCAALAMFSIAGGHWALLQSVAWAQMLVDYSRQSGSLTAGVEQTFDGKHPCNLCQQIASAKQQERAGQQAPSPNQTNKVEKKEKARLLPAELLRPQSAVGSLEWPMRAFEVASSREEQPPTPPPRVA